MDMPNVIRIDSTFPISELQEFCNTAEIDKRLGSTNMTLNWDSGSFLDVLYNQKRFDGPYSGYYLYYEDNRPVTGIGCYPCNIDNKMITHGVRTYTIPSFFKTRVIGKIRDHLEKNFRESGFCGEYITFNEYNLNYLEITKKLNDPSRFKNIKIDEQGRYWRDENHQLVPYKKAGPFIIHHTKQWILYHLYDESHEDEFLRLMNNTMPPS